MTRAILRYKNGIDSITWVWSEPDGMGDVFLKQHQSDGENVFKLEKKVGSIPVYGQLEVTRDDFYGYEAKEG